MTAFSDHRDTEFAAREIFLQIIEHHAASEWATVARDAASGNSELYAAVRRLLDAHSALGPFQEHTLVDDGLQIVSPQSLSFGSTVGPYRVLEEIGQGGMGTVYLAEQLTPIKRQVAIKVIKPGMDSRQVLARFESERQAMALMDHPYIAKVYSAGETSDGRPYVAVELVRGLKITNYIEKYRLSRKERLELLIRVCHAVEHAHQKGVIHRDLKPSNILVQKQAGTNLPKIIDFGLAKATSSRLTEDTVVTQTCEILGTPIYMSPEQAGSNNDDIDTRSDVYSLGVLLYEMLTGTTPVDRAEYQSVSLHELLSFIRTQEVVPPSRRLLALSKDRVRELAKDQACDVKTLLAGAGRRELDWIAGKALENQRDRRYGTAGELAADVQRFLDGDPVLAGPPSNVYRLKKVIARNKFAFVAAVSFAIGLLAFSFVTSWNYLEVLKARDTSRQKEQEYLELARAMSLQAGVSSFREFDLIGLATQLDDWERLGIGTETDSTAAGLGTLLAASAKPTPKVEFDVGCAVYELDYSSANAMLCSVDEKGDVKLWALSQGADVSSTLGSHGEPAHAVAFSPDGHTVTSGSTSGQLRIWNINSGECKVLRPVETGIETVTWSPNGKYIALGARYNQVWVGDANGEELFRIPNDQRHESLVFSPDSQELYVPTRQSVEVWSVAKKKRIRNLSTIPLTNIRSMCLGGANKDYLLVSERYSDLLLAFHRISGERFAAFDVSSEYPRAIDVAPDGQWFANSDTLGTIDVVQFPGRKNEIIQVPGISFSAHKSAPDSRLAIAWIDDSHFEFATGGEDGFIRVWNRSDVLPVKRLLPPTPLYAVYPSESVSGYLSVAHDWHDSTKKRFISGLPYPWETLSRRQTTNYAVVASKFHVGLLSIEDFKTQGGWQSPIEDPIYVGISSNSRYVFAASEEQVCCWTSTDSWRSSQLLFSKDIAPYGYPCFTDQGKTLLISDTELRTVVELDTASGQKVTQHESSCYRYVTVSQDGTLLAAVNNINLRVWERKTGRTVLEAKAPTQIRHLYFFPDNQVLLTAMSDGDITAWHLPTGELLGSIYKPQLELGYARSIAASKGGKLLIVTFESFKGTSWIILGQP